MAVSPREVSIFPVTRPFISKEDLVTYFAGDKLVCLICGRSFVQLAAHIMPAHNLMADEYKQRFGIPWTYGLAGTKFRAASAKRIKAARKSGKLPEKPTKAHIAKLVESAKQRRKNVTAVSSDNTRKILETHSQTEPWGLREFNEYLKRIASGRTPNEVGQDTDLPGIHWFRRRLASDSTSCKQFELIWKRLPYGVLARARKLPPRFNEDVLKLRRKGLPFHEIAERLGVGDSVARTAWFKLKRANKLTKADLNIKPDRYESGDFDRFLAKFAAGERLRNIAKQPDMPSLAQYYRQLEQSPALRRKHAKVLRARIRNK